MRLGQRLEKHAQFGGGRVQFFSTLGHLQLVCYKDDLTFPSLSWFPFMCSFTILVFSAGSNGNQLLGIK